MNRLLPFLTFSLLAGFVSAETVPSFRDRNPQRYKLSARASELDSRAKEYPEIDFVFGTKGNPPISVKTGVDDHRINKTPERIKD